MSKIDIYIHTSIAFSLPALMMNRTPMFLDYGLNMSFPLVGDSSGD
jgi:hypothetical protein